MTRLSPRFISLTGQHILNLLLKTFVTKKCFLPHFWLCLCLNLNREQKYNFKIHFKVHLLESQVSTSWPPVRRFTLDRLESCGRQELRQLTKSYRTCLHKKVGHKISRSQTLASGKNLALSFFFQTVSSSAAPQADRLALRLRRPPARLQPEVPGPLQVLHWHLHRGIQIV